jgi:protein O-GlcNAc transferase
MEFLNLTTTPTLNEMLDFAKNCIREKRTDAAIAILKLTCQLFSTNKEAAVLIGRIYLSRGDLEGAINYWKPHVDGDEALYGELIVAMLKSQFTSQTDILFALHDWSTKFSILNFPENFSSENVERQNERMRIGYHCSFWNSVSCLAFIFPLLYYHDKNQFSITVISPYPVAPIVETLCDQVIITGQISHLEFISCVRKINLDVFVELSGFSHGNRFAAMAARLAKVQVSYFNHLAPLCIPNIDWVFVDIGSEASKELSLFPEQVYKLPGPMFCSDYNLFLKPDPPNSLPFDSKGFISFGCLSSVGKITDLTLDLWCEVLRRLPTSSMILMNSACDTVDDRDYMISRFSDRGIHSSRIVLYETGDFKRVIETYKEIDIALDTFPYTGGTTTAEALNQGVPVVTLKGDRVLTWIGASLNAHAGLHDLVATTHEEFCSKALGLSRNIPRLRRLRKTLRQRLSTFGGSDVLKFTRMIEMAYVDMSILRT